jgi:hypothetical protein
VDDSQLKVEDDARDQAIADVYKRYLDLVLRTASVSVIVTWGAWDIARVTGAEGDDRSKGSAAPAICNRGRSKARCGFSRPKLQHAPERIE